MIVKWAANWTDAPTGPGLYRVYDEAGDAEPIPVELDESGGVFVTGSDDVWFADDFAGPWLRLPDPPPVGTVEPADYPGCEKTPFDLMLGDLLRRERDFARAAECERGGSPSERAVEDWDESYARLRKYVRDLEQRADRADKKKP